MVKREGRTESLKENRLILPILMLVTDIGGET
jgi:hypothetical protein